MRSAKWYDFFIILIVYNFLLPLKFSLVEGIFWGFGIAYLREYPVEFFLWPVVIFLIWWFVSQRWK